MKKIKKISQIFTTVSKILGSKTISDKDTYSCNYINDKFDGNSSMGNIIVENINCKNIFDGRLELGAINDQGVNFITTKAVRSVNFMNVRSNAVYTQSSLDDYKTIIFFYDALKNFISLIGNNLSTNTFTTPSNCVYIKFCTYVYENVTDINSKFQIEPGSVATDYVINKNFEGRVDIITSQECPTNEYVDDKRVYVKRINFGTMNLSTTIQYVNTGISFNDVTFVRDIKLAVHPDYPNQTLSLPIYISPDEGYICANTIPINDYIYYAYAGTADHLANYNLVIEIYYTKN